MQRFITKGRRAIPALVAAGALAGLATVGSLVASDHQDTPEVELDPRYDVNDVYAFPSPERGRVVLVLGTSSPLTPAQSRGARFATEDRALYQLKVDNTGDAVEDLVFQITFTDVGRYQRVTVRGPYAPNETGTANTLLTSGPMLTGFAGEPIGTARDIRVFTGPRDDPFFIDLEQFFRIIPDRKPETGPLSQIPDTPSATSFRPQGQARDFVRGLNDLAIVIELPISMLVANPSSPSKFGVWGTISRARQGGTA